MQNIFENIDNTVNKADDFYTYATGNWINNNPNPAEYPTWDVFNKLDDNNIDRINDIILNNSASTIIEKKIQDFYDIIMNYDKRNDEDITPALRFINEHAFFPNNSKVGKVTNNDYIIDTAKNNFELFFSTGLTADSKGSGKYEVCIYQAGLGLGNKDYYLNATEENKKIRSAYINYIMNMFKRYTGEESTCHVASKLIWDVEMKLAEVSYTEEQLQDPILNYNRMSVSDLSKETNFDWHTYLCNIGMTETDSVIVSNIEFLKVACNLLNTLPVNTLKYIYEWNIMTWAANKLSDDIYDIDFDFSKIFTGSKVQFPKWKRAVNKINDIFSDPIGEIYVKKYFNEAAKNDVVKLVELLKESFIDIIKEQGWMSNETKEKALDKLLSMRLKIGYPNKFEDYSDIPIDDSISYFDNCINIANYLFKKDLNLHYNKEIDKDEWHMTPQTINAYYDCIQNEICFPAAILQYPFYEYNRHIAENFGGICTIIAHEMTHAFDNHGRLYDKNGILTDWWSAGDADKFTELTQNTKDRFDNIEVLPGLNCNGSLTLGENIADYGGVKIAYLACKKYIETHDIQDSENWQHHFFIAYANNWAGITNEETIRTMITCNEHTVEKYRVNGTLPMFTEWINYYDVKPGNKLYIDVDKRAKVW